jgi:Holliday junction resolvase-like predicted endonuclease
VGLRKAQRKQSNEIEKQSNEFVPAFSVADTPLKVSDFTGKNQSMPFDKSQLNKSTAQASNADSMPISGKDSDSKRIPDSDYSKKMEGRYGEEYVLKLLKKEYQDNNVIIIDLNENGKTGIGADIVVQDKTNKEIIKLVEVKSTTGLKGSEQRISGVQWETARKEGDLYWMYCVYNVKNNPEVIRIQNPIQKWKDGLLFADPVDFIVKE